MSGLINHITRLALSLSLMDRELFIQKVSEVLEQYKNDPEQMEKIAAGLYQYMDEMRDRMNTKAMINDAIDYAKVPSAEQIDGLTEAIKNLTHEIHQQNKGK